MSWRLSTLRLCLALGFIIHREDEGNKEDKESLGGVVWDSGWVTSKQQEVYACRAGEVTANKRYRCLVKARDNHQNEAQNSEAFFTTAIGEKEWKAKWIGCKSSDLNREIKMATKQEMVTAFLNMVNGNENGVKPDRQLDACNLYRKDFVIENKPKRVYLSITAHGLYEAKINGKAVTDTRHRTWLVTDESFRYCRSGCLYSDLLIGEKQDGRVDMREMNAPSCNMEEWKYAEEKKYDYGNLYGICCEPVRCTQVLEAKEILLTPKGELVVDMGQNMVGYLLEPAGKYAFDSDRLSAEGAGRMDGRHFGIWENSCI